MIVSSLHLTRADRYALRIYSNYQLHCFLYSLYFDTRSEAEKTIYAPRGILYADKGEYRQIKHILILSNKIPMPLRYGEIESKVVSASFLQHQKYIFEVIVNPSKCDRSTGRRKRKAIIKYDEIVDWFMKKAPKKWGFEVNPKNIQLNDLGSKVFSKKNHEMIYHSATVRGELKVINRNLFIQSFELGIGPGKAFGFGLLQLVPL